MLRFWKKGVCILTILSVLGIAGYESRAYAGAWGKAFKQTFKAMKHSFSSLSNDYSTKRQKAMGQDFGKENSKDDFDYDLTEDGEGVVIKGYVGTRKCVAIPVTIEDFPVVSIAENGLNSDVVYGVAIPDTVVSIASHAFPDSMVIVMLPETMKVLPHRLFEGGKLEKLTIPDIVEEILPGCVYGCKSLLKVEFSASGNLKCIGDVGGDAYKEGAFELCGIEGKFSVPEGVQVIGDRCFAGCHFTSVEIPASVRFIGKSAFEGCEELEKVKFDGGTESVYILPGAFNGCVYLSDVDFNGRNVIWCRSVSFDNSKSFIEAGQDMNTLSYVEATAEDAVFSGCKEFKLKDRKLIRDSGYKGEF